MNWPVDNYEVVYVAIRSLNSGNLGQIVQIAAKFEYGDGFERWIKPSLSWAKNVIQVRGLRVCPAGLFFGNTKLSTVPQIIAMQDFLEFLKKSSKPVVLVGHCTETMYQLLLQAIFKTNLVDEFHSVIAGFGDSRPAFMNKFSSQRSKEAFELPALAKNLLQENYTEQFQLAANRLRIIEKLVNSSVLRDAIVRNAIPFEAAALKEMVVQYSSEIVGNLLAMRGVLTLGMLKKVAQAGVSLDVMREIHRRAGSKRLIEGLSARRRDGKPMVTANAETLKKIADFFDRQEETALEETVKNSSGEEIDTILYSSYQQERELLENSKHLYTEIIRGKDNRPLYTVEYTD